MNNELFDSLPQISTINAGDVVLISESVFDTDGKFIGERMIKAAIVGTTLLDKVNYAKLFVLETMGDGFELLNTNITRPINNIMKRGRMLMKKEQGAKIEKAEKGMALVDLYVGDELLYKGNKCHVVGLSDCRNYVKINHVDGTHEEQVDVDDLLDNSELISRK